MCIFSSKLQSHSLEKDNKTLWELTPFVARVNLALKHYLFWVLETFILFTGSIFGRWCHVLRIATSLPFISSFIEYYSESFSRGWIIHIPFPKFWKRTSILMLQNNKRYLVSSCNPIKENCIWKWKTNALKFSKFIVNQTPIKDLITAKL